MTIVLYTSHSEFEQQVNNNLPEAFGPFADDNEADVWVETQQVVNGWKGSFHITSLNDVSEWSKYCRAAVQPK